MRSTILVLCTIVALTTHLLVVKYARSRSNAYVASVSVLATEVVKLALFVGIQLFTTGRVTTRELRKDIWLLSVPALIYSVQNNMLVIALTRLDITVFVLLDQFKVLSCAMFSVFLLKRKITVVQWFFLFTMCMGIVGVNYSIHQKERNNTLVGVSAVLLSGLGSGFAGVYWEMLTRNSPVWVRNIQLAAWGVVFSGVPVMYETPADLFVGCDSVFWFIVLLQAVSGCLISMVVTHWDSMTKTFVKSAVIVLTSALNSCLSGELPSAYVVCGGFLVVASIHGFATAST